MVTFKCVYYLLSQIHELAYEMSTSRKEKNLLFYLILENTKMLILKNRITANKLYSVIINLLIIIIPGREEKSVKQIKTLKECAK